MAQIYSLADILGEPVSRQQAIDTIKQSPDSYQIYQDLKEEYQQKLLSFLMGQRGLKITYDSFFRMIMSPAIHPERLEHFLSAILRQPIRIQSVLSREGMQLAEAGSLVIMDIIVALSDGSIVNVEIQKVGYKFPGARSSCYVSDMTMRQYNLVKSERGKDFSFKDLKPVFLIILMEKSSPEFLDVSPHYIHRELSSFDSGATIQLLSKIIYISLDTFHSVVHSISTELEAWLTFLSADNPTEIVNLVNAYPEFLSCYHDIIEFRKKPKELIYMFSEALSILDRNTAMYMVEEWKQESEELKEKIAKQKSTIAEQDSTIAKQDSTIAKQDSTIAEQDSTIAEQDSTIAKQDSTIAKQDSTIAKQDSTIAEQDSIIAELQAEIARLKAEADK